VKNILKKIDNDRPKELIYPGKTASKIISSSYNPSSDFRENNSRIIKLLTEISEKFDKILAKIDSIEEVMNVDEIILYNTVQYLKERKIIDDEDYNQYITNAYENMEDAVKDDEEDIEEPENGEEKQ
jgi:hypothetical protein